MIEEEQDDDDFRSLQFPLAAVKKYVVDTGTYAGFQINAYFYNNL